MTGGGEPDLVLGGATVEVVVLEEVVALLAAVGFVVVGVVADEMPQFGAAFLQPRAAVGAALVLGGVEAGPVADLGARFIFVPVGLFAVGEVAVGHQAASATAGPAGVPPSCLDGGEDHAVGDDGGVLAGLIVGVVGVCGEG
jgi:hypothetical protein